jgi:ribonucleotide monophosphatase NagD (HAD superfamily)
MARRRQTIAVDLDGTIHRYSRGWHDGTLYDPPIEGAREALARIHARYRVVIFTTRVNPALRGGQRSREAVVAWLEQHGFRHSEHWDDITHEKPPALAYIDDRAVRFTTWDETMEELGGYVDLP